MPSGLRAPRGDGAILATPSLETTGTLLQSNRQRFASTSVRLFGRPFADLRELGRQEALASAQEYLAEGGEPLPILDPGAPLLLAGHQPELFHPGVWIKNFALNRLAQVHGAVPLNLVVDNDTEKSAALILPRAILDLQSRDGTRAAVTVPYDRWSGEVPYEERPVLDESLFQSLPERAAAITRDWGFRPILGDFWTILQARASSHRLLGERFAAGRRTWERSWNCHNLELPVSRVCRTDAFAYFAGHLLANLAQFQTAYNSSLGDYRERNHLRSAARPVPDLSGEGDWQEAPFWAWRADHPRRGRLLVRSRGEIADLRVENESWPSLMLDPSKGAVPGSLGWKDLEGQGFKIRTRALTTTLFARLFLGQLFMHGIGGGKYDEVTDEIIRRFYGFEPPAYLVLSGTLLLPLAHYQLPGGECRSLAHDLRDLRCNPQRHAEALRLETPEATDLVVQKNRWIQRRPENKDERRERYRMLRELTTRLRPYLTDRELRLREQLAACQRQAEANQVLQGRDYAFCLFPEEKLRAFCTAFLGSE